MFIEASLGTVQKSYFNPAEYAKDYRKNHKDKIAAQQQARYTRDPEKILAAKMIAQLNHGVVQKPTAHSIDKYALYRDDSDVWRSRIIDNNS